jgi:glycosyltransferase involved in cell wall biosynthesis
MNLFIQIPCFNEQKTIIKVIESIPKKIKSIKKIRIVILDDGSTDKTVSIVKKKFPKVEFLFNDNNKGLAETFKKGIDYALLTKADIIVNIDGDNQYKGSDIPRLINPIINKLYNKKNGADYVIGERNFNKIKNFSILKKFLQYFGNFVIRNIIDIKTKDVTSGFRAYNRVAASKIFYNNSFTYTIESLIHLTDSKLTFSSIDIETNKPERKSRLFKSNLEYIFKTLLICIKTICIKKPLPFFSLISLILFFIGLSLLWHRYFILNNYSNENIFNSFKATMGISFLVISLQSFSIGILSFINSKILYINLDILSRIKLKK